MNKVMKNKIASIPNYWYTLGIGFILLIVAIFGVSAFIKSTDSFNTSTQHTVINQEYTINDNKRLYGRGEESLYNLLNLKDGANHRSSVPISLNVKRADNTYVDVTVIPSKLKITQTSKRFAIIKIKISQDVVTTTHYLHKWNIFNRDSTTTTNIKNVHKDYSIKAPSELMSKFTIQ